jgi:hypothetical protein
MTQAPENELELGNPNPNRPSSPHHPYDSDADSDSDIDSQDDDVRDLPPVSSGRRGSLRRLSSTLSAAVDGAFVLAVDAGFNPRSLSGSGGGSAVAPEPTGEQGGGPAAEENPDNSIPDPATNVTLEVSLNAPPRDAPPRIMSFRSRKRIASALTLTSQSLWDHTLSSNGKAFLISSFSLPLSLAIFALLEFAGTLVYVHMATASAFVVLGFILVVIRLMRRNDELYRKEFTVMLPVMCLVSAGILHAFDGNTGHYTTLLVFLTLSIQSCVGCWVWEESPRPNIVTYWLSCLPTAIVLTVVAYLPPLAVAIPGRLLEEEPKLYTLWCGLGYPLFAFALRKLALTHFVNLARTKVAQGAWDPSDVVPFIGNSFFCVSASLLYGNVMLMYLSHSVEYALVTSAASVLIETAGKIYAVYVTLKQRDLKVKARFKRMKRRVARSVRLSTDKDEDQGREVDETLTDEYWEDLFAMYAVRWNMEIIAEKCCILSCAFATKLFVQSSHSGAEQFAIAAIFYLFEVMADACLVYCLNRWWSIPFLRLPKASGLKTEKGKMDLLIVGLIVTAGVFNFLHAYGSVLEWFGDKTRHLPNASNSTK